MRIIVLVKEVPDTYGDRVLSLETGLADRGVSEAVLDEIGERAVEAALRVAEAHAGVEVTVVSMGPAGSVSTVRKALAMGADRGVHVVDEGLVGADAGLTAEVLAAAVSRAGFDVVLAGNASTDGAGGVVPAMVAEVLSVPHLTGLSSAEISPEGVSGTRPVEGGVQRVSAGLPAVVSVTEAFPDGRFPNFKGIMAAKKKPLDTVSVSELGVDVEDWSVGRSILVSVAERPPRAAGVKIVDEGDAGEQLAAFLAENRLA
ncbi:electron transfer flavoprotein subunit beta/FixA family protein [Leucobacter tenebrionis]|uniref:electron transfer flavoprotein subunit beta/FixA family protein n=1 Tax=Leucobacter tenebrionis TaxID=2873270 RepID=UPI001CA63748|nr:electron transfer flavoprotein subunit beta/FixA family protein [Leucobacter tenebrionis]QZY52682.1 electron transfer flavoprotein subunit beta/FixA family protein [Leucobacter tenebrionis]